VNVPLVLLTAHLGALLSLAALRARNARWGAADMEASRLRAAAANAAGYLFGLFAGAEVPVYPMRPLRAGAAVRAAGMVRSR
jgi:hypothetical protein